MSDHRVKISVKSDHHAHHNLSSNPTDKVAEFDSNLIFYFQTVHLGDSLTKAAPLQLTE